MRIRVSETESMVLDWMVAKCESESCANRPNTFRYKWERHQMGYSSEWDQGGPIIEREGIHLLCDDAVTQWTASAAYSYANGRRLVGWRKLAYGPTALIAAMRCYVVSKLGDEVEVPEELLS